MQGEVTDISRTVGKLCLPAGKGNQIVGTSTKYRPMQQLDWQPGRGGSVMQNETLLDRGLPSDVEAERAILGAVLLDNGLIRELDSHLEVDDFYLASHREITRAMLNLDRQGMAIDLVTLGADLKAKGVFERVGGATYVSSLIDGVPKTESIGYYARIVKHTAQLRRLVTEAQLLIDKVADGEDDIPELVAGIERIAGRGLSAEGHGIQGVYLSLDQLFNADIEKPEEIVFGVHRGEVGAVHAVTNYGKSTLLLNTALSATVGQWYRPAGLTDAGPRRVVYLDSESPASRLKDDLQTMLHNLGNPALARSNFTTVVDARVSSEPLCLSRQEHFRWFLALVKTQKADLVVIDTAASAFELHDENSNAEVTRRVMNPLKRLARETNCAVIFTHHQGKAGETQSAEAAYRGRGASAFGALSRTVFTIERDAKKGPAYVVLRCAKTKGTPFGPVLLKLDADTRWFEECAEPTYLVQGTLTAQEVAAFVGECGEATSGAICDHFTRAGKRTVQDRIREAKELGLIEKQNQKAPWRLRKSAAL